MFRFTSSGSFKNTTDFFKRMTNGDLYSDLHTYGRQGVIALQNATPQDTGKTASSWRYRIIKSKEGARVEWFNTNRVNGTPIAIIIQYGHGTGTGGWVEGKDYINPAIQPIFDKMANEIWKKVTR